MPDLVNFSITPGGAANVNVPRATISCQVVDTDNQSVVLADFTGANAIQFPGVLATLTPEQRADIVGQIANWLILTKAGLQ